MLAAPHGRREKFAAAEAWLLEQAGTALPLNSAAAHLAPRLGRPGLRVRDAVAETGFTERQVLSLFRRWIGVSPKQYARISRFQHAAAIARASWRRGSGAWRASAAATRLGRVAAETGYADQTHLTHEFHAFAGMTPGAYVAAYRGLTNYLPITLAD